MKKFLLTGLFLSQLIASGQQHKYKVIAYYTGNTDTLKKYPLEKLTHIIYSFLRLQNDTLTFHNEQQRQTVIQLTELTKKHSPFPTMGLA